MAITEFLDISRLFFCAFGLKLKRRKTQDLHKLKQKMAKTQAKFSKTQNCGYVVTPALIHTCAIYYYNKATQALQSSISNVTVSSRAHCIIFPKLKLDQAKLKQKSRKTQAKFSEKLKNFFENSISRVFFYLG